MASVVNSIEISAKETLHCETVNKSLHGGGKKRQVIGWNEEVWPFRDTALFWHSIWVSCGKPLNTEVHNIMKTTRNVGMRRIK